MSSIDGKISCDRCGEYNHERSMVFKARAPPIDAMCIGCDDEVEELDSEERVFFPCDECGTMTADHMLASIETNTGMRNCCPMCYSECYEDSRGVLTEYTISYLEVIKHEVKVTAMSRAQAERIVLSGNKAFALRTTRLPQTIGKSIVVES
jgi:predicted metal-binding protein